MDPKKFSKLLSYFMLKGVMKMCKTLEEADVVLVYNNTDYKQSSFMSKENDKRCNNFTENDIICFVRHANPRDRQALSRKIKIARNKRK